MEKDEVDLNMSKYDSIPLKPHKARIMHNCHWCNSEVKVGAVIYYQNDRFLQTISRKKFCEKCVDKYGLKLLEDRKISIIEKNQKTLFG